MRGHHDSTAKYWEALSTFESRDYVDSWFKGRHGRHLNARAAYAITACFIQGREYFDAAATAATSVRPLLLYYGVLEINELPLS
ncbi:YaaC family protein [Sphingomonas sp. 2SG]|uniref:YaaC family protein n=1 Tax=Sphingomonas sp. 2SG TaxID=2502201 RepID=UPI0010F8A704|nr:YaaC family protein [Sphingomonas sp. 2SG]